jgi:SAM-dependent methyltransferase
MALRPLRPEHSVSTNFTTRAPLERHKTQWRGMTFHRESPPQELFTLNIVAPRHFRKMEDFFRDHLICPHCHSDLSVDSAWADLLVCSGCQRSYSIDAGVPDMVIKSDSKPSEFDYIQHYETDAEAFDYFEERTGATEHSERRLREVILSFVPAIAKTILDVGCGSAWVAKAFLPRGYTVCSLDASTTNPKKALNRYPSERHYGVAADAFRLPFRDNSFDCIIAAEIIEHVTDPVAFVGELFRVLAPGGKLILSTPYKEVIRYELCIHCNKQTPVNAHLHSFDEKKLASLLPSTGSGFTYKVFNNKLLLFARSYVVGRYLPLPLWLFTDKVANLALNKPVNIVVEYSK